MITTIAGPARSGKHWMSTSFANHARTEDREVIELGGDASAADILNAIANASPRAVVLVNDVAPVQAAPHLASVIEHGLSQRPDVHVVVTVDDPHATGLHAVLESLPLASGA